MGRELIGFGERLRQMREKRGISQQKLADKLIVKRNTISNYESETSYPSFSILIEIVNFLDTSADYLLGINQLSVEEIQLNDLDNQALLSVEEKKVPNENYIEDREYDLEELGETSISKIAIGGDLETYSVARKEKLSTEIKPMIVTIDNENRKNIVVISNQYLTAYPTHHHETNFFNDLPVFNLPFRGMRTANLRCFQVADSSMANTVFEKDFIVGDYLENFWYNIKDGDIYVIVTHSSVLVRRIVNHSQSRNKFVLLTDNPDYPIQELALEDILEVWHMVIHLCFSHKRRSIHDNSNVIGYMQAEILALRDKIKDIDGKMNK
ncbi:LexA family transcriptional regulator [Rhodocytophaga rosea]|uniref:LexA family transcriptional regulator n=1 Tax=Rhodocytophaga rosea TaxID=2704465 RepID=A0A6C0GH91_9BACT|nr:LexA family transcriptional regulator [Rhodocytophaga rosea]QHT67396.1 LexA family transcriptional regulator [Rhodocytophaga rosea]